MTTQTVTQSVHNPTTNQSKNKRKKNRKKNKKSSGNGLASPVENTIEPNVTSHVNDLSPQKADDHLPIDKSSVPSSVIDLPVTSSFLSEINTELDIAFGSNSLIDKIDQSNSSKPPPNNIVSAAAADIPEKEDEPDQGLTEESIKPNLVDQAESVAMATIGDKKPIETSHKVKYTENNTQQPPTAEESEPVSEPSSLSTSSASLAEQTQEIPTLKNISVASIQKNENVNNNKGDTIRMVSPISDESDTNEITEKESKSEQKNDSNVVVSVAERSFFNEEKTDENSGLSDKSKNKSSEFPLHANDLSSSPMPVKDITSEVNVKDKALSNAISSAINSAIASRCIDTEHIINHVVHNIESGKYRVEPRNEKDDTINEIHKVDKSSSRTVVSSNVYKNAPSIEVLGLMEETVQCPEPAVGSMGQRMPSSMKTADSLKVGPVEHQRKSTFAAAFKRRNCIIL